MPSNDVVKKNATNRSSVKPASQLLTLPRMGLGCNSFGHNPFGGFLDYKACKLVVDAAIAEGVASFDTADVYGLGESEEILGRALRGYDREQLIIATKFGYEMPEAPQVPWGSRPYVRWAVESSLRRLQTDYVDLLQIHRADPATPIVETLTAVAELIAEGKVRLVGCSMFSSEQLDEAVAVADRDGLPRLASCMMHYSLLDRSNQAGPVDTCVRLGLTVLPFFPLEGGLLTGKYRRDDRQEEQRTRRRDVRDVLPETWNLLDRVQQFADVRAVSLLELALGGLSAFPGVGTLFVGATRPEQVRANAEAIKWTPTPADLDELLKIDGATELA